MHEKQARKLTQEEIAQMREALLQGTHGQRDEALFSLCLNLGLRVSEALSLEPSDVLDPRGRVRGELLLAAHRTKGKKPRRIAIGPGAEKAIKNAMEARPREKGKLFQSQKGKSLSRVQAHRIIKNAAESVGLPGHVATHSMRRTFALDLHERADYNAVVVQQALGHSSLQVTLKYLGVEQERVDALVGATSL